MTRDPGLVRVADLMRGAPDDMAGELGEWYARLQKARNEEEQRARARAESPEEKRRQIGKLLDAEVKALESAASDPEFEPADAVALLASVDRTIARVGDLSGRFRFSAADRAARLAAMGPPSRVPTGIDFLDRITGGGLWAGRLINTFGGAPNAGKTGLAVQIAHHAARNGFAVVIYCADEDLEGALRRIGQQNRLNKADLERRDPGALSYLVDRLRETPGLAIVDQDEDDFTLEGAADVLESLMRGPDCKGGLLVVDSAQRARAHGTDDARDPRARADAVVNALKRIGARLGVCVLCTSEVGRGYYGNPNARTAGLAAFKESGAIEYASRLALVLCTVEGDSALVDVEVVKNKSGLGNGEFFRLKLDYATCSFSEVSRPPDEGKAGTGSATAEIDRAILEIVARKPGCTVAYVKEGLKERKFKGKGVSGQRISDRIDFLCTDRKLVNEGKAGGRAKSLRVAPAPDTSPGD